MCVRKVILHSGKQTGNWETKLDTLNIPVSRVPVSQCPRVTPSPLLVRAVGFTVSVSRVYGLRLRAGVAAFSAWTFCCSLRFFNTS